MPAPDPTQPSRASRWRGLFLDLDGTIADTLPVLRAGYDRLLAAHGAVVTDAGFAQMMATPPADIPAMMRERLGIHAEPTTLLEEYRNMVATAHLHAPTVPGARELMKSVAAAGIPIAVVTSAPHAMAEAWLQRSGLGRFTTAVVGGDDVDVGKPDPAPYLLAMQRLACPPERGLAVEDSPSGARSAVEAGLTTWLRIPGEQDIPNPDLATGLGASGRWPQVAGRVEQLDELLPILLADAEPIHGWPDLTPWFLPPTVRFVSSAELAADVAVVAEGPAPQLHPQLESRIDSLWDAARADRRRMGAALPRQADLFAVLSYQPDRVVGGFVPNRWWVAQQADETLAPKLRICPVIAQGVAQVEEGIVLARRHSRTERDPGCWEFATSCALDRSTTDPDGNPDPRRALLVALAAELGLAGGPTLPLDPVTGLLEPKAPALVLAWRIATPWAESDVRRAHAGLADPPHDALLVLAAADLAEFAASGEPLTDVAVALVGLLSGTAQ